MKKFIAVLASCAAVTVLGAPAFAAPPETPSASEGMQFDGTVATECSVDTISGTSADGPIQYSITSPAGGASANIKDEGTLEERATELVASDSVTFDCNTKEVSLSVTMTPTTTPTNIPANLTITRETKLNINSGGATLTAMPLTSSTRQTDGNGDIAITLESKIKAGGEELPAGAYSTSYTITVVAQIPTGP